MKAPTQLRTERGHLQDMKLSVFNSTSRQGRVSSLFTTSLAISPFSNLKAALVKQSRLQWLGRIEQKSCNRRRVETYSPQAATLQACPKCSSNRQSNSTTQQFTKGQELAGVAADYLTCSTFHQQNTKVNTQERGGK